MTDLIRTLIHIIHRKIKILIHTVNNRPNENTKIFSLLLQKQRKQTNFMTDTIRIFINTMQKWGTDKENTHNQTQ